MNSTLKAPQGFDAPIYVTRPVLPPLSDYVESLEKIWQSGFITNGAAQHQALEQALCKYLQAPHLSLFNNGTLALLVACQALEVKGEVVTTPFTFAATPHVLAWNNVTPVFADIDPVTLCIDPNRIEDNVTDKTSAVLGVHVYGMPCNVHAIQSLAQAHSLKVIYDGAHAFGTEIDGKPIVQYGDATMLSFHATKLFHSAEGGALCVANADLKKQVDLLKNFGIKNEEEVLLPGINGKMNELQAALGLLVLQHVDLEKQKRQALRNIYEERMNKVPGVQILKAPSHTSDSQQYLIAIIDEAQTGCSRDDLHVRLKPFNIISRKYFYPLCSSFDCYKHLPSAQPSRLPNAHRFASQVLSLPLYGNLTADDVHRICDTMVYCLQTA
jgi:dTDP-4-amino-4,6-dideoxygalactose transaminase